MPDVMSPEKRSALMARIRGRDTQPERTMFAALRAAGIRFRRHVRVLPGCTPDIVLPALRIAIFVDGDFWHGWRFPLWRKKLSPFWEEKIALNRARDRRKFVSLRRHGWAVLRIWEHQVERDVESMVMRVRQLVCTREDLIEVKHRRHRG